MRSPDKRDALLVDTLSPATLEAAQRRIRESGGELPIWGVLREDVYETRFGDGFYLHLRGLALTEADADRLAALESATELTRWHVRPYRLGLKDDAPCLLGTWREEEEFSINDFVEILAEMPPGATASMLLTGSGENGRRPGPHMLALG